MVLLGACLIATLFYVYYIYEKILSGNLSKVIIMLRQTLIYGVGASLLFLAFSGKISAVLIGICALLPLASRLHPQPKKASFPLDAQEMTREKAAAILGVSASSEPEAIKAAHKKLMQKLHPDKGGSAYLAQVLNGARECLLKKSAASM
jgi:hypothetical protein